MTNMPSGSDSGGPTPHEARLSIRSDRDIVHARQTGRSMAMASNFAAAEATLIATAISELARNILRYAGSGEILLQRTDNGYPQGIRIVANDHGPGIADLDRVMLFGYSTSGSLGLGLPGVKRIMDAFEIESETGRGTTVTVVKWRT